MVDQEAKEPTKKQMAKQIKKSLDKFKGNPHPPKATDADRKAVEVWRVNETELNLEARSLLEAYHGLTPREFCEMLDDKPLPSRVLYRLIGIALHEQEPDRHRQLGHMKAEETFGAQKSRIQEAWENTKGTFTKQSKIDFAEIWAPKEKVAVSTVQKWLRKR